MQRRQKKRECATVVCVQCSFCYRWGTGEGVEIGPNLWDLCNEMNETQWLMSPESKNTSSTAPPPQVHEPWESEWGVNCNFLPTVVCLASSMTTVSNHSKNWRIYRIPESTQLSKLPVYSFLPCSNLCVWCSFTLNRLNLLGCTYQEAALFPAHSYPLGCCFSIPHPIFIESYSDPWPCQFSPLSTATSQFVYPSSA